MKKKIVIKDLLGSNEETKLSGMLRYNTLHTIQSETVAEHSYYVVLYSLKLCDLLNIDEKTKLKILEMAIVHDIPEIYTSDVNAYIKNKSIELNEILESLENAMMFKHMPSLYKYFKNYSNSKEQKSLEYLIVKLADLLSVISFISVEKELGNKHTIIRIEERCIKEINKIISKIENIIN